MGANRRFLWTVSAIACAALLVFQARAAEEPVPQSRVTGIVVDEAGTPLANISVRRLYRDQPATATTDAQGKFTIEIPTEARSTRALAASNEAGDRQGYFRFADEPIAADFSPRIVLRKSRAIEVSVIGADERPLAGIDVAVVSSYWPLAESKTGDDGKAVLQVPADAPLDSVFAYKADVGLDYLLYRKAGELANDPYRLPQDHAQPLTLTLSGTRTISLRVVDDKGNPLAGAQVHPWYIGCPKKGGTFQPVTFTTKSDASGLAVFRVLPANNTEKINFWVRLPGYDSPQRWMFDPSQPANEITAVLVPQVLLCGSVMDAAGKPAVGAAVAVAGDGYQFDHFRGNAQTGADGKFEMLVTPDQYYMLAASKDRFASPPRTTVVRAGLPPEAIELVLQPATRVHGAFTGGGSKPLAGKHLTLYHDDRHRYHELPEAEQLPNPNDDRKAIFPGLAQSARTDAKGQFEFFTGPGHYYITGVDVRNPPKFEVTGEPELKLDLQATTLEQIAFSGRVVLQSELERGVAEVAVVGWSTRSIGRRNLEAVSDANGEFQALRFATPMFLYAKTSNGLLAGLVNIKADAKETVIPIGPLAAAHGRLVDDASGLPLPGRQIDYGFRIEMDTGGWTTQFGSSTTTDARGEFTLERLLPGWPFDVSVVVEKAPDGRPRGWRTVTAVLATKPEVVELGDVKYVSPDLKGK